MTKIFLIHYHKALSEFNTSSALKGVENFYDRESRAELVWLLLSLSQSSKLKSSC